MEMYRLEHWDTRTLIQIQSFIKELGTPAIFSEKKQAKTLFGETAETVKKQLISGSGQASVVAYDTGLLDRKSDPKVAFFQQLPFGVVCHFL